jgi:TetR/AcrR family transcriptional repressor of uid operon
MVQQARALATRETILAAAGVVFSNSTYSKATLLDIITEAGVTQGALYFHFDGKHQLACEVIKRQHQAAVTLSTGPFSRHASGIEGVVRLTAALTEQLISDPIVRGGLRLTTESPELFPDFVSRPFLGWIDACEGYVSRAIEEGDVACDVDTAEIARFIVASYTGAQVVSYGLTEWADIYESLEQTWRFILRGILVAERHGEIDHLAAFVHG